MNVIIYIKILKNKFIINNEIWKIILKNTKLYKFHNFLTTSRVVVLTYKKIVDF